MLKKNLIVLIIIILILIVGIFTFFSGDKKIISNKEVVFYKNKALNIKLREFDKNSQLISKIVAKSWTTFTNKGDFIEAPKIQNFTNNNSQITANFAQKLSAKRVKFIGNINIISDDSKHNLKTNSLIANTENNIFYSNDKVEYFSANNKIIANGINIDTAKNVVKLLENGAIFLANGNKILGENINIKQQDNLDFAFSDDPAKFIGQTSIASSSNGFNLYDKRINLFGKVVIKQGETNIFTKDLQIENNIYTANKTKYQELNTKLNADKLYFDELKQIIELYGNVRAIYE